MPHSTKPTRRASLPWFVNSWIADGAALTDVSGRFTYQPIGLPYDQSLRIWACTERTLTDGTIVRGDPMSVAPVRLAGPVLPVIQDFGLFDPTTAVLEDGRWRTSDIRMSLQLAWGTGSALSVSEVRVEFAHDRPGVGGDEETVVGTAAASASGSVLYAPTLAPGDVTIRARVVYFDAVADGYARGPWSIEGVALRVEPEVNRLATVTGLRLAHPLEPLTAPPHALDRTFAGEIRNPDGYVAYTPVEFREAGSNAPLGTTSTNRDGLFSYTPPHLAGGTHLIEARTYDWDYVQRQWISGPWTAGSDRLTFVLDIPASHEVASLGLLSDTGPIAHLTANPALLGTIQGGGSLAGVTVGERKSQHNVTHWKRA